MEVRIKRTSCSAKATKSVSKDIQVREMMLNGMMTGTLGRGDTYQLELFKCGCKVWIKDAERVWTTAELIQDLNFDSSSVLVKRLSDSEEIHYDVIKNGLPFLCNPDILLGKDDLTHLSCLSEPEILNNLRYRFEQLQTIYTYSGICLVAINPYGSQPHLYSEDIIDVYRGQGKQVRNLIPHIYAISEEAFFDLKAWQKNQSIIVSGESGAGKTVSAKFVMKYLTHTSSGGLSGSESGIERRVLASNPIMESIGNAKTIRNDNSSRFGKFIQINFNDRFSIDGAEIKTYLLEKSRVVFQSAEERNYHIFYQMTASNTHPLLANLNLDDADQYNYTNQGALTVLGVDDNAEFIRTTQALSQLKISEEQQKAIFKTLAGVLFLGNIDFTSNGNEYAQVDVNSNQWFNKFCGNFSIDASEVSQWLCAHQMKAGNEIITKRLNVDAASSNRNAIAKLIYAAVFNFIVEKINVNLCSSNSTKKSSKSNFIGVLDIYGFESYEDGNSFEQFCINYANERLQNSFNNYVFKLEQAEYQKEEIPFEKIQFYDNSPCIQLISNLIQLLDEQSKTGRGTDEEWLLNMQTSAKTKDSEHLQLPKIKNSTFLVKHFASNVTYCIDGFLEKNLDTVSEKLLSTIANSKLGFLHELLSPVLTSLSAGNKRKKTVAVKFHESLKELNDVLDQTRPHYIRCVKPNDMKASFCFEPKRAIEQMRASGVLETVRIAATGFPNRWTYSEFFNRYRVLNPRCTNPKEFVETVANKHLTSDTFAFGKTKFFMKIGQVAKLEIIRQNVLHDSAVKIQTIWRGFIQRQRFKKLLQMHHASIKLQTAWRSFVQRRKYQQIRSIILDIQSRYRANIVRQEFNRMRYERSVIIIQRCLRGYLVRRERIHYVHNVTIVQACVRRWFAKKEFRKLKTEAKSVNHLSKLNKDLANKLIEIRQNLDTVNYDLSKKSADIDRLNSSILSTETELYDIRNTNENLENQIQQINEELENERLKNKELNERYEDLRASTSAEIDVLSREKNELATLLEEKSMEVSLMQEQLIKNADLLISPDFQGDASSASSLSRSNSELTCGKVRLLLEQQETISELRCKLDKMLRFNERLQLDLNAQQLGDSPVFKAQDLIRIQNLELLNQRYKSEIDAFIGKGEGVDTALVERLKDLQDENERIQEENNGLRSLLTQFFEKKTQNVRDSGHWSNSNSSNASDDGLSAPNSEIEDFLSNQRLLRQYRNALTIASQTIKSRDEQISQLDELRLAKSANDDENLPDDSKKVAQLANENLILQKRLDRASEDLSIARSYLSGTSSLSEPLTDDQSNELLKLDALSPNNYQHSGFLEVFNIPEFAKILIHDLKPRLALKLPHCLPAQLLLTAFRYFDHTQKDLLVSNLFNAVHVILKEISANSRDDFDIQALWLTNVWSLLNLLRQYSGEAEEEWTAQNTEKQNALKMQYYNFEPIRNQLKLRVEEFYANVMKHTVEPVLAPKISAGILHHESVSFKVAEEKTHHGKLSREPSKDTSGQSLDDIKEFLSIIHTKLQAFGADQFLISQIFAQIAKWMSSLAMNQLVYRKDLCTFEKSIQIKHNVMEIKGWLEKQKLGECASDSLEPLVQAANLMMSRKVESNLDILAGEMTSKLTAKQIITILTSYNPPQGFEEDVVNPDFIAKLSQRLEQRNDANGDSAIMLGTFLKPFETQHFVYSAEDIQKLTLPSCLKLDSVVRLI